MLAVAEIFTVFGSQRDSLIRTLDYRTFVPIIEIGANDGRITKTAIAGTGNPF